MTVIELICTWKSETFSSVLSPIVKKPCDEGAKSLAQALNVRTSLSSSDSHFGSIGAEGAKSFA